MTRNIAAESLTVIRAQPILYYSDMLEVHDFMRLRIGYYDVIETRREHDLFLAYPGNRYKTQWDNSSIYYSCRDHQLPYIQNQMIQQFPIFPLTSITQKSDCLSSPNPEFFLYITYMFSHFFHTATHNSRGGQEPDWGWG
jgi:hypothetical protein